jgi:hypothetical protein
MKGGALLSFVGSCAVVATLVVSFSDNWGSRVNESRSDSACYSRLAVNQPTSNTALVVFSLSACSSSTAFWTFAWWILVWFPCSIEFVNVACGASGVGALSASWAVDERFAFHSMHVFVQGQDPGTILFCRHHNLTVIR